MKKKIIKKETKKKVIPILYCGKRLSHSTRKLYHLFLYKKEELRFNKARGVYIGNTYEAHESDESIFLYGTPKDITPEDQEQHPKWNEWWSKEIAASTEYRHIMMHKRLLKGEKLLVELILIKKFTKRLTYGEKKVFCEWIINQVSKKDA